MTSRSLLLFFLGSLAFAQFEPSPTNQYRDIRVHVAYVNGDMCDPTTRVVLLDRTSKPVDQNKADAACVVEFLHVPVGTYHVAVSGRDFASTDSSDVVMNSPDSMEIEVRVRRGGERGPGQGTPLVRVADFNIPSRAKKEFAKANAAMKNQDWTAAIERLHKAVAIYPDYASAYNNLGVAYARLGDHAHEREEFEKAISINDRFAPVYVNLALMHIGLQDFADAETALSKATELAPEDGPALVMLANVELMNHHLDEAIGTTRKVHTMLQPQHSIVHWVAARAFEEKKQYEGAVAELKMFLSEEAAGARATKVRKELAEVQSAPH